MIQVHGTCPPQQTRAHKASVHSTEQKVPYRKRGTIMANSPVLPVRIRFTRTGAVQVHTLRKQSMPHHTRRTYVHRKTPAHISRGPLKPPSTFSSQLIVFFIRSYRGNFLNIYLYMLFESLGCSLSQFLREGVLITMICICCACSLNIYSIIEIISRYRQDSSRMCATL